MEQATHDSHDAMRKRVDNMQPLRLHGYDANEPIYLMICSMPKANQPIEVYGFAYKTEDEAQAEGARLAMARGLSFTISKLVPVIRGEPAELKITRLPTA